MIAWSGLPHNVCFSAGVAGIRSPECFAPSVFPRGWATILPPRPAGRIVCAVPPVAFSPRGVLAIQICAALLAFRIMIERPLILGILNWESIANSQANGVLRAGADVGAPCRRVQMNLPKTAVAARRLSMRAAMTCRSRHDGPDAILSAEVCRRAAPGEGGAVVDTLLSVPRPPPARMMLSSLCRVSRAGQGRVAAPARR